MIRCSESAGALEFAVRVVPRASRSGLAGEYNGALRVRITAPPVDGAANDELLKVLARAFDVPPRNVQITAGMRSKLKQVRVAGATRERLVLLAEGK